MATSPDMQENGGEHFKSQQFVEEEIKMNPEEKAVVISNECLVDCGEVCFCIDDRKRTTMTFDGKDFVHSADQKKGPQFLGGSLGIFALAAESMSASTEGELDFEQVYAKTVELHEKAGLKIGVHMDDHHGHMDQAEISGKLDAVMAGKLGETSQIPGCGFAGLLSNEANPLGLSDKVTALFKKYPNIVDEMVRRGAKLTILTGDHADKQSGKALAVENMDATKTVSTETAIAKDVQTYNHDTGKLGQVLEGLDDSSKIMEINSRWLKITTNILAGMDPVKLAA